MLNVPLQYTILSFVLCNFLGFKFLDFPSIPSLKCVTDQRTKTHVRRLYADVSEKNKEKPREKQCNV